MIIGYCLNVYRPVDWSLPSDAVYATLHVTARAPPLDPSFPSWLNLLWKASDGSILQPQLRSYNWPKASQKPSSMTVLMSAWSSKGSFSQLGCEVSEIYSWVFNQCICSLLQIDKEFLRITTKPLLSTFFAELDQYAPRLMEIFLTKGGTRGKKIRGLMLAISKVCIRIE